MFKPVLCALCFLTRLPLPNLQFSEREVGQSAAFFSWVGALLSLLLWSSAQAFAPLGARTSALLLVAFWTLFTGALHLDGLADSVDGLSGGRGDRNRALEIMRDSRIGAHGAVALVLLLLLKWTLLETALTQGDTSWLAAPVVARFACTLLLAFFPYARTQGLGSAFSGRVGFQQILISALGLVMVGLALGPTGRPWPPVVGIAIALGVAAHAHRKLGGLTGDVHGAAIELSEVAVLFAAGLPVSAI